MVADRVEDVGLRRGVEPVEQPHLFGQFGGAVAVVEAGEVVVGAEFPELFEAAEIVQQRGRGGGYYMTEAPFELAELKLLVDAVYASKFITARKSKI